jgi:hypothetical protein
VAGHHLWGGSATTAYIYIFFGFLVFFFFKCDRGILGIKRPNGLNCHNLKVFFFGGGGLSVTLETLEAKVKIGGYFRGVKCNFP